LGVMRAEALETARLTLRRPRPEDAEQIFARYAGDAEVTRFMSWPQHRTVADTRAFLELSDAEWERWPAGPYLVHAHSDGRLVGSTGYAFETADRAATGYVFAKDAWGQGYATEAVRAIVEHAPSLGIRRLYAICHVEHRASARVLEKCGFACEGILQAHAEFPNLARGRRSDVRSYGKEFTEAGCSPRAAARF
jgi:[ribosomal protein S5]-alanine N-acetyltransferase